jgi:hypothetical protein
MVMVEDGEFVGKPCHGRFIERDPTPLSVD